MTALGWMACAILVLQADFRQITQRYKKGTPTQRMACVADLAVIADAEPRAAAWLRAVALKDPAVTVRESAIRALGPRLGNRADLEALLWTVLGNGQGRHGGCPIMRDMVTDGGDLPTLRGVVGEVLRAHGSPLATETLGLILLEKRKRRQLVVGLVRKAEPGMTDLRRALAAELLGEIGSDDAVELLKEAVDGKKPKRLLRLAAIRALGYTYRRDVLPYLRGFVDTQLTRKQDRREIDTELRHEAHEAIARIQRWLAGEGRSGEAAAPDARYRQNDGERPLEIVFIFDATSNMAIKFDAIRDRIEAIIREQENDRSTVRVALMAFRDLNNAYLTNNVPLTTRIGSVIGKLRLMKARGGKVGDSALARPYENAVERLNWSRHSDKRIYIFGDARVDHPDTLYMQVSDMAVYERARTHVFYTVNKKRVRQFMERLARLGEGICDYLESRKERDAREAARP